MKLFCHRIFCLRLDEERSSLANASRRVLRASLLEPPLSLVFINDLAAEIKSAPHLFDNTGRLWVIPKSTKIKKNLKVVCAYSSR